MKLNLSNVQLPSFEPLPAGNYAMKVVSSSTEPSKAGNPMWMFELSPIVGRTNVKVRKYISLPYGSDNDEKFLQNMKQFFNGFMDELGIDVNDEFELEADELVGLVVMAKVVVKENAGKSFNDITGTWPYTETSEDVLF